MRNDNYTKQEALDHIATSKEVTASCLDSLGISLDLFLRFCHVTKDRQERVLSGTLELNNYHESQEQIMQRVRIKSKAPLCQLHGNS